MMDELDQLWAAYRSALDAALAAEWAWQTFQPGPLPWSVEVADRWDRLYTAQQAATAALVQVATTYRAAKIRQLVTEGGAA